MFGLYIKMFGSKIILHFFILFIKNDRGHPSFSNLNDRSIWLKRKCTSVRTVCAASCLHDHL